MNCRTVVEDIGHALMAHVEIPNYTPVDERKGYIDLDAYRVVIEDGVMVGVYPPKGMEHDPVVMGRWE